MPKATLTVLVPTFNEERSLADCLSCLTWADQIIVVDSFSNDGTVAVAKSFTQHVYQHEYVNSATQKNWALANLPIDGEWTLIVDADERIVPELATEIQAVLESGTECAGFFLNRRNYFCGRWIRRCGWYPSLNLRLFCTGAGRYEDRAVDADVIIEGSVGTLRHDMLHYSYQSLSDFLGKLDRYTTWEAMDRQNERRERQRVTQQRSLGVGWRLRRVLFRAFPLWLRPPLVFLNMFFWERGFLDGGHGFVLSSLYAWREFVTCAKVWEARRQDRVTAEQTTPS